MARLDDGAAGWPGHAVLLGMDRHAAARIARHVVHQATLALCRVAATQPRSRFRRELRRGVALAVPVAWRSHLVASVHALTSRWAEDEAARAKVPQPLWNGSVDENERVRVMVKERVPPVGGEPRVCKVRPPPISMRVRWHARIWRLCGEEPRE